MIQELLTYDFETTDTDPAACGIVQASLVSVGEHVSVLFDQRMVPEAAISEEAAKVHGWTKQRLEEEGCRSEAEQMEDLCEMVMDSRSRNGDKQILCGYNSEKFDATILRRWMDKFYGEGTFDSEIENFDLMNYVLRHHRLDSYKLGDVYNHFFDDYSAELAHESTYDCVMVGRLIHNLVPDIVQAVAEMQEPALIEIMPFGKFSGRPFHSMPRSYMRYMLKLDINKDVRHSMQAELKKRPGK